MIDKLKYINIGGVDYPAKFTLNVLENIQDEFGSIENWEKTLNSEKNIKTVIWTFKELINEGIDIEYEIGQFRGDKKQHITHKQAGRLITDLGIVKASKLIAELLIESNITGNEDDDEKNLTAAQKK